MRRGHRRPGKEVPEDSGLLGILTAHPEPPEGVAKQFCLSTPGHRDKQECFRNQLEMIADATGNDIHAITVRYVKSTPQEIAA